MCCFFAAWITIVLTTIQINYSQHLFFFSHSSITFYTFGGVSVRASIEKIPIVLSLLWRLIKSNNCNEGHPKLDALNRPIKSACEMFAKRYCICILVTRVCGHYELNRAHIYICFSADVSEGNRT